MNPEQAVLDFEIKHDSLIKKSTQAFLFGQSKTFARILMQRYRHIQNWYLLEPDPSEFDSQAIPDHPNVQVLVGSEPDFTPSFNKDPALRFRESVIFCFDDGINKHPATLRKLQDDLALARQTAEILAQNKAALNPRKILNACQNFQLLSRCGRVSQLHKLWMGKPALCLAAGPSLRQDIATATACKDRVLTLCCDAALTPCLDSGLVPDIITTTDSNPGQWDLFFARHVDQLRESMLIAPLTVNPQVLQNFPGKILLIDLCASDEFFLKYMLSKLYLLGRTQATLPRSNVGLLNLAVAALMQAGPICLVGQDLGYYQLEEYASPYIATRIPAQIIELGNQTLWRRTRLDGRIDDIPVTFMPTNQGGTLAVPPEFAFYKHDFETYLTNQPLTVFSSAANGVQIKGAPFIPLETFCTRSTAKKMAKPFNPDMAIKKIKPQKIEQAINDLKSSLTRIAQSCEAPASHHSLPPELAMLREELNILGEWAMPLADYLLEQSTWVEKDPDYFSQIKQLIPHFARDLAAKL